MGYSNERCDSHNRTPQGILTTYLLERSATFRELNTLREKGWQNPDADKIFQERRRNADTAGRETARIFYEMMKAIGRELQSKTGGFSILNSAEQEVQQPGIVDFCMAPGGFLSFALSTNAGARALAFSLPTEDGGHRVLHRFGDNVDIEYIDITMLADDMGVTSIPQDHADADKFLPSIFGANTRPFHLAICDGQVLRTQDRAEYRQKSEATRLITTQLALGLEHLKQGGTMIVLLHEVNALNSVRLLHQFSKFSTIKLFKPSRAHAIRSSFYMVASSINPVHSEATKAVEGWKETWRAATFGTEQECHMATAVSTSEIDEILNDFGDKLVQWSEPIWDVQRSALAKQPWTK